MITPEGNICLIDFNISSILNGQGIQTMGYTPHYASPEQVQAYEMLVGAQGKFLKEQSIIEQPKKTVFSFQKTQNVQEIQNLQELQETVLLEKETGKETEYLPEKVVPLPVIDCRSDIYSVGATLYTLLTGKLLETTSVPDSMLSRMSNISEIFQIILQKALEVNPAKRYQNAGQMYHAILQINKKKKRYRHLLWKQKGIVVVLAIFFSVFFLVAIEGKEILQREKQEQYTNLIEQMKEEQIEGMTAEQWEQRYKEAISLYPNYLDAHYEKANYYFKAGEYEETISYIEQALLISLEGSEVLWGNLYYLYAESFFRLEDYKTACLYYQTALSYIDNPYLYRDYAISLAYLDRITEAQGMLEEATENGMEQADVFMVQGELNWIEGKREDAISCLKQVLKEAEDEYLRQRAYLIASEIFAEIGTKEALQQDVTWLLTGIKELSLNNRLLLYERLEQDYIQLGDKWRENQYYLQAVKVLEEIRTMGWETYRTYSNAIVLCQKAENLEDADVWAEDMLKQYPEHYTTYLRLAYLAVEKQERKPAEKRDYIVFEEYYNKAEQLYKEQMTGNKTDAEMQRLERIYEEVKEGGWLE